MDQKQSRGISRLLPWGICIFIGAIIFLWKPLGALIWLWICYIALRFRKDIAGGVSDKEIHVSLTAVLIIASFFVNKEHAHYIIWSIIALSVLYHVEHRFQDIENRIDNLQKEIREKSS